MSRILEITYEENESSEILKGNETLKNRIWRTVFLHLSIFNDETKAVPQALKVMYIYHELCFTVYFLPLISHDVLTYHYI